MLGGPANSRLKGGTNKGVLVEGLKGEAPQKPCHTGLPAHTRSVSVGAIIDRHLDDEEKAAGDYNTQRDQP